LPATPRQRFIEGSKTVSPILLGAVPFGLVVGVSVAATPIDNWVGWSTSIIVFAGAAQVAVIDLIGTNAIAAVAIATPIIINLRHAKAFEKREAQAVVRLTDRAGPSVPVSRRNVPRLREALGLPS